LDADAIDEDCFTQHTSLGDLVNPDLLIRTGGEHRVSNFLLWDLAYTELYFTDAYWPDFDADSLDEAIATFAARNRRYGQRK
jgi:undecaprenyl diphosphate synthase